MQTYPACSCNVPAPEGYAAPGTSQPQRGPVVGWDTDLACVVGFGLGWSRNLDTGSCRHCYSCSCCYLPCCSRHIENYYIVKIPWKIPATFSGDLWIRALKDDAEYVVSSIKAAAAQHQAAKDIQRVVRGKQGRAKVLQKRKQHQSMPSASASAPPTPFEMTVPQQITTSDQVGVPPSPPGLILYITSMPSAVTWFCVEIL